MAYYFFLSIQMLSVIFLGVECVYIYSKFKTRSQSYLLIFCIAALINNVGYMGVMTADNLGEASLAVRFCYIGKVWIPLALFAMILELARIKIPKVIAFLAVLIQLFIMLIVLTSEHHNLYYSADRKFVDEGLFPHAVYGHSMLYVLYTVLLNVYIVLGLYLLIRLYYKEENKDKRKTYVLFLFGVLSMALGLVTYLLNLTGGYDATSLGYAISGLLMAVSIIRYNLMDTLSYVKDFIADYISEGIVATNKYGDVIYYNERVSSMYPEADDDYQSVILGIKDTISAGDVICLDGKIYEPVCNPLYKSGEFIGHMYVLTDVTAIYNYMKELQKQKDIAEAANNSKSKFLSIASHEIRTPMNAIIGMTDIILSESDNLTEQQKKFLQNIRTSGDSLVSIVNDILDDSKIEAGKMEIVEDVYNLRKMTDELRLIIENRIGQKSIKLIYEIDDSIPEYIVGDGLRIRQILINLMNNAVKFTDEGFIKLIINCEDKDDNGYLLRFCVKDSGQGIKSEDLSKLGEAFTRIDVKRNHKKEGTGLGLAISRDFVNLMGGKLGVTSEYGVGSEFFFSIWQKEADAEVLNDVSQSSVEEDVVFTAPDAKMLVVDDSPMNIAVVKGFVKQLGISLDTANSGAIAIEMIKKNRYDIIFMDYMMPEMDGIEVTSHIRAEALNCTDDQKAEYLKNVPIIVISGDDSAETKESFFKAGINDYLIKPIIKPVLNKMIYKWLRDELIIK